MTVGESNQRIVLAELFAHLGRIGYIGNTVLNQTGGAVEFAVGWLVEQCEAVGAEGVATGQHPGHTLLIPPLVEAYVAFHLNLF